MGIGEQGVEVLLNLMVKRNRLSRPGTPFALSPQDHSSSSVRLLGKNTLPTGLFGRESVCRAEPDPFVLSVCPLSSPLFNFAASRTEVSGE